jgi:hypothetical protein
VIVQISSWQNTQRAAVQHLPTVPTTYPNAPDQRRRARQPLSLPVTFRSDLGQHAAAWVQDATSDGFQIHCNVATAQVICPLVGRLNSENGPVLQASFTLALPEGPQVLSVGVQLLYRATRLAAPCCVLGFRFVALRPKAQRVLAAFFGDELPTQRRLGWYQASKLGISELRSSAI